LIRTGTAGRSSGAGGKPLSDLSNAELATLLRQRIAREHLVPLAEQRIVCGFNDETEMYEGQLEAAIDHAKNRI